MFLTSEKLKQETLKNPEVEGSKSHPPNRYWNFQNWF